MSTQENKAKCRGCGMELIGTPYFMGGEARHPKTNEVCFVNFYGGYICSDECDRMSTERQKRSIDDHNDPLGIYRMIEK